MKRFDLVTKKAFRGDPNEEFIILSKILIIRISDVLLTRYL